MPQKPKEEIVIVEVYELKSPVTMGDTLEPIKKLNFRSPMGKDMRDINLTSLNMGDLLTLASKITGEPDHVFDRMIVRDAMEVCNIVGKFLDISP